MEEARRIYKIEPLIGVGPVRFGMSRQEVRRLINLPVESFQKSSNSQLPADDFNGGDIHVHYKAPDICNAVECFPPGINLYFQLQSLFTKNYSWLETWFKEMDPGIQIDETGFRSLKFGIGVYAPKVWEPNREIKSVIVFEKDYYK